MRGQYLLTRRRVPKCVAVLWLGLVVVSLAAAAMAEGPPSPGGGGTKAGTPREPRDRVMTWFSIGFSSADPATRCIGWGLPQGGWKRFVDLLVRPQLRWGVRRVLLHNPFGALDGEVMQFSQFPQARAAGKMLSRIADRDAFVAAWKPLTDQGVEVIAYIGSPSGGDRMYAPLLEPGAVAAAEESVTRRRALENEALEPMLAAGMSIAFDAASGGAADDPVFELAERLRKTGTRVYIEALPPASAVHWKDYPAMCNMWFWDNPDRPSWGVAETSAGTTLLTDGGKVVTWAEWDRLIASYRDLMSGGRDIAVPALAIDRLIRGRVPFSRLVPDTQPVGR